VTEEQEDAGLDIVEHGMYGYPEQFIPPAEFGAASTGPAASGAATPALTGTSTKAQAEEVPA
jgi:ammonium transporter, Amt family